MVKWMEQLELQGQLAWVNILAAKGVNISSRRSTRRICSLNPVLGGSLCLFDHRGTALWRICSLNPVLGGSLCLFYHRGTVLRIWTSGGLDISGVCCKCRLFAAVLKELGVPDRRSLHLELLRLTVDSYQAGR